MSLGDDGFSGLGGGLARFDSFHGRTDGALHHGSLRYPSPFFDIAHTYLPTSVAQMFRWCRYYFLTNPLINAVTYKMAEYPITPLIFDEEDVAERTFWEDLAENQFRLRPFQIEVGLDYFCYGNAFISIHWPFLKYLVCTQCKHETLIAEAKYKFRNLQYHLACDKCGVMAEAKVREQNIRNLKGIRLIRWNPENVRVEHNELTGDTDYFFDIPTVTKNDILMGKRHIVEKIPNVYIEALRSQRQIKFTPDNLFHLKRPTIAQKDMGWGIPLILPVLKDTYYLQILRKAQEAIAHQHIVPLRILFPQAGGSDSSPYTMTDLGMWRRRMEAEIAKWRQDPNYIPILPLPVGNEVVGGEGRALMLHQEMEAWSHQIVAGMHVPIEFVFGGLQYSGSNVSMRMLENQFLGFRTMLMIMTRDFVLGRIADYMGRRRPKCHFARFKMADDLQRAQLAFTMNQAMKISDTTLLAEMDYDVVQEEKFKEAELSKQLSNQRRMQMANTAIQGDVLLLNTRYQIKAQKIQMEAGVPPQGAQPSPEVDQAIDQMGQQLDPSNQANGDGSQQPMQGEQVAPGVPDTTTVYPENADQAPDEGVPSEIMSRLNMNSRTGGGLDLTYVARRVATDLENKEPQERFADLQNMKGANPQLYGMVLQILSTSKGSQTDPLNPLQSPLPEQRPPRRKNALI